ncbi:MAG: Undecaprenyl phosphate-alpha-4-amino-4-deoxy-L-arabinose arabinosyl transferase [Fimbriimonadaceae bacterium]|nr:Undecaprenyl phosphate-alpha-4-amino-4-deoxy-L-arabinose arabinosyl transferase [Fimbriimonadaceae bacterium]
MVGLFDLDEGFYGAVASEMLRRGEWITPYYNGSPWFEKPILIYWLAIPSLAVFGETFGPKLPSVVCTLGTALLIYRLLRDELGEVSAQASAIISVSSILAAGIGRLMMTDAPFVLALSAAILLHWKALAGLVRMRWAAGAALGAAVLAKGPIAIILFVLIIGLFTWRTPAARAGSRGGWLGFLMACAVVIAAWYLPCYLANREEFVQRFLVEQNVQRFAGGDQAHSIGGPLNWLFFFIVVVVGWAPWSFHLVQAWPRQSDAAESHSLLRLCAYWAGTVFIVFSLSGSKLPHYILPLLPATAILVGDWIGRRRPDMSERSLRGWLLATPTGLCLLLNWAMWSYYHGFFDMAPNHAELHAHAKWLRQQPIPTAMFQMSRRQVDRGTGRPKIQETGHPSVVFYMNRVVPDLETLEQLREVARPAIYVLTRDDRIVAPQEMNSGLTFLRVATPHRQDRYAVWLAERSP